MPFTDNVVWDERLEAFEGSDTNQHVRTAAARGMTCGECREPLDPGSGPSLIVEIHQGPEFAARGGRFTASVYHRHCQAPDLILRADPLPGRPE